MNETVGILGCGYLGSRAAAFWKRLGLSVIGFVRSSSKEEAVLSCCHRAEKSLDILLQNVDDLLVSVAPHTGSVDAYRETYLQTALQMQKIIDSSPSLRLQHIFYTSSASVYGERGGEWVSEMDPVSPLTEAAKILVETENIFLQIQRCGVVIFRIGELTGPGREIQDRVRARQGVPFPGTGNTFANFTPVDLLIRGLEFARQKRLTGIFNLCSEEHPTRKNLYDQVAKELQIPSPSWDSRLLSPHAGNKRLCCNKLVNFGFNFLS